MGGPPRFSSLGGLAQQLGETLQGIGAILLLAAESLGLDDNHALTVDAVVLQLHQPGFNAIGQTCGSDVQTQVDRRSDFVDVLTAGSLGPNGGDLDVAVG